MCSLNEHAFCISSAFGATVGRKGKKLLFTARHDFFSLDAGALMFSLKGEHSGRQGFAFRTIFESRPRGMVAGCKKQKSVIFLSVC